MQRRQKQSLIIGLVSLLSIWLIVSVLWIFGKEWRFSKYDNTTAGFSIKYPLRWAKAENQNGATVIFSSPTENKLDFFQENVNVVVTDLSRSPKTLIDYSDLAVNQMKVVFKENLEVIDSSATYLSGKPAHQFIFIGKGPEATLKFFMVWTIDDNRAYQITYSAIASTYDKYLGKFQRMIKSFEIL